MSGASYFLVVLIFNSAVFTVFTLLFILLRKCTPIFTPKFYHISRRTRPPPEEEENSEQVVRVNEVYAPDEQYAILQDLKNKEDVIINREHLNAVRQGLRTQGYYRFVAWFKRLCSKLWFSEDHVFAQKCGHEAAVMMRFMKLMSWLFFIFMFFSLVIILPINVTVGHSPSDTGLDLQDWFTYTSIQHLTLQPAVLWAHIVLAIVFTLIYIVAVTAFSASKLVRYFAPDKELVSAYSVRLKHLAPTLVTRQELVRYLEQKCGIQANEIVNTQIALLEFKERIKLQNKLEKTRRRLHYANARKAHGKEYSVRKWFTFYPETEYYEAKYNEYLFKIQEWDTEFQLRLQDAIMLSNTEPLVKSTINPAKDLCTRFLHMRRDTHPLNNSGDAYVVFNSIVLLVKSQLPFCCSTFLLFYCFYSQCWLPLWFVTV